MAVVAEFQCLVLVVVVALVRAIRITALILGLLPQPLRPLVAHQQLMRLTPVGREVHPEAMVPLDLPPPQHLAAVAAVAGSVAPRAQLTSRTVALAQSVRFSSLTR
jgi:hypothetical protein